MGAELIFRLYRLSRPGVPNTRASGIKFHRICVISKIAVQLAVQPARSVRIERKLPDNISAGSVPAQKKELYYTLSMKAAKTAGNVAFALCRKRKTTRRPSFSAERKIEPTREFSNCTASTKKGGLTHGNKRVGRV